MMNPNKRARLNADVAILSRPFRSPLKANADKKVQPSKTVTNSDDCSTLIGSTNVIDLQREYASFGQQLRKLRQDLDAVQQASKLHSSNQEEKLNNAIQQWKSIARDAADDAFVVASQRVNNTGGLQAWKKNSQNRNDWFDRENPGDHPSSDGVDALEQYQTEQQPKDEDQEEDEEVSHISCLSNLIVLQQSFNMPLMLRQLNIDPDVLGFDENNERWST